MSVDVSIILYTVRNLKTGEYLNYASKHKKGLFFGNWRYYVITSPFPTLRPVEHIKHFEEWIKNTPEPREYEIVAFREVIPV